MAKTKKGIPQRSGNAKTARAASKPVASSAVSSTGKIPAPIFNIHEVNDLIHAVHHSNVTELMLEKGDFKITIRQGHLAAPTQVISHVPVAVPAAPVAVHAPVPVAAPSAPAPVATTAAEAASDGGEHLHTIKSPMIGTFYRASVPGKSVFVNVGDDIKSGDVLCIVEAMKLFNEIESEVNGKIVKVLVDDNSPVEYDQPLFLVQLS